MSPSFSQDPQANLPVRLSAPDLPAPSYGPPAFPQFAEEESGAPDLWRLLAAVNRYKWLVVLGLLAGIGAGVAGMRLVHPVYQANATIWVQSEAPEEKGTGPIQSAQLLSPWAWIDLIKSNAVLDSAVLTQRLFVAPRVLADTAALRSFEASDRMIPGTYDLTVSAAADSFTLARGDGQVIGHGAVGDSIGTAVGFRWVPQKADLTPGGTMEFWVSNPTTVARNLGDALKAEMAPTGNFITVSLTGGNPVRITGTVNSVVDRFIQVAIDLKREKLNQLTQILESQLTYSSDNLHSAEVALQNFRVATITLPSDRAPVTPGLQETQDPVFRNYFDLNIDKEQVRVDREALERALAAAQDSGNLSTDAFSVIGAVQHSPDLSAALKELTDQQATLRTLRLRYTDEAPQVKRVAEAVDTLTTRTIPQLGTALLAQLRAREADLGTRVTTTSKELQGIPQRAIEEARLQRQVDVAAGFNTILQQRVQEARLQAMSAVPDVRILDRALVPTSPLKNTAMRILLMGIVGGLALGLGAALGLDRLDRRVRYPEQVTRDLGLTILGAIPHAAAGNGSAKEDADQVLEAVRGLRLSLVHAYGTAGPLLVTVTSPGPGDGKSFVSSNLALSFADNGHRTLLVDGDVRRGRQHELFKVVRKPGLTDYLSGHVPLEKILVPTSYSGLSVIACGTRTSGAPELLGSPAMQELLTSMRSRFDVILVDSPPLGAGVDPFLLGTLTGHIMVVLRTGISDRSLAEAKLDMLQRLPVRVLGAVMNDVRKGETYGYYHHYYAYLPGYEAKDEGEVLTAGPGRRSRALPPTAKLG